MGKRQVAHPGSASRAATTSRPSGHRCKPEAASAWSCGQHGTFRIAKVTPINMGAEQSIFRSTRVNQATDDAARRSLVARESLWPSWGQLSCPAPGAPKSREIQKHHLFHRHLAKTGPDLGVRAANSDSSTSGASMNSPSAMLSRVQGDSQRRRATPLAC